MFIIFLNCTSLTQYLTRGVPGSEQWTLGLIERGSQECFLIEVADRGARTLYPILLDHLIPGLSITNYSEFFVRLKILYFDKVMQKRCRPAFYYERLGSLNRLSFLMAKSYNGREHLVGTVVFTDGWRSYNEVGRNPDFTHRTVSLVTHLFP